MKKFIYLLSMMAILIVGEQNCAAEVKSFHAESSYLMDRGEPIRTAQDTVFNDAVRKISESANVFIDSLSLSRDSELELDRVEIFTAAILRIRQKVFDKEIQSDGGLKIIVKVDAELDTDNAAELLNELREAKNSAKGYEEVLKDYTERKKNFDTVYGEYLGSYQKRIMRKIRDGCKLQSDGKLDEALKLYNEAIEESIANKAEFSLAYIKRGVVYAMQNRTDLTKADFEKALALNDDEDGMHLVKAVLNFMRGEREGVAKECRAFLKGADIIYYDAEITAALNMIIYLGEVD